MPDARVCFRFHLLSLTHKDGNHTSVQFKEASRRDAWETGLRTMISGASAGQSIGEVKVPKEQYQPIKSRAAWQLQLNSPGERKP